MTVIVIAPPTVSFSGTGDNSEGMKTPLGEPVVILALAMDSVFGQ